MRTEVRSLTILINELSLDTCSTGKARGMETRNP
jgi:hypothetical protein